MSSAVNNFKWEEHFGLMIDYNTVTFFRVTLDGVLDLLLDLLTTYIHDLELKANSAPPLSPLFTNHHSTR
jgi:hypothetical protein